MNWNRFLKYRWKFVDRNDTIEKIDHIRRIVMPRKKKEVLTLEEQLKAVEKEIEECSTRVKELNKKKKSIKDQIEEDDKKKLYDAAVKAGMSVNQCIELIDSYEPQILKEE